MYDHVKYHVGNGIKGVELTTKLAEQRHNIEDIYKAADAERIGLI